MVQPVERDSRGIVHPQAALRAFRLDRFAPAPAVARFVDRYWLSAWNLPPGEAYEQHVLTHPVVNIVFADGVSLISGVQTGRFQRVLEGRGRALGVMFRPAGFRPFLGRPMSEITDSVFPLSGLAELAEALRPVAVAVESDAVGEHLAQLLDRALAPLVPALPQPSETTTGWAERVALDRTLTRVDGLAATVGATTRTLQRAFVDHVGISPKWIIRRYRIYEAAERAARDEEVDWAELAVDLGYADQSHFVRDFTTSIGQTPARYAATGKAGRA